MRIPRTFAASLTILAILFILGVFWLRQIKANSLTIGQELENRIKQVRALQSTSKVPLTTPQVSHIKERLDEVQKNHRHLLNLLDTAQQSEKNSTPLEFKEELLKTRQASTEKAAIWSIKIPSDMGFSEFEGGNIPDPQDVPLLTLQMDTIQTLINFMIESNVYEVVRVDKKESREVSLDEAMYQILPFGFSIKGSMQSLSGFLHKLYDSKHFFIVRRFNIESSQDGVLTIDLEIDAIKLKKKST
jgi:hypothetical protein